MQGLGFMDVYFKPVWDYDSLTMKGRTSFSAASGQSIPRKRNHSLVSVSSRAPKATTSNPSTPQAIKDEEEEDEGKDDYGDIGINNGENRDEETQEEERERLKST
jgi:hypothetical protein